MRYLTLLLVLFGLAASGQQPAEEGPRDSPRPSETAPDDAGNEGDEEVFIPTEEIPADKEVTFPADI